MPTPLTVVIFGASGDPTARKLVPALFNRARDDRLPADARVLGVARPPYTDDAFRDHLGQKAREMFQPAGSTTPSPMSHTPSHAATAALQIGETIADRPAPRYG